MSDDAWGRAREAARAAGVTIRPTEGLEEAAAVVAVMTAVWGAHQLLPREFIRAMQGAGIPPLAAFDGDEMVGFVLGFIGGGPDGLHVHSHQLAVRNPHRAHGVGFALKLAQAAAALDEGLSTVRWTFDPLVARNAYFNLSKLGAVADRYHRHFYGDMTDVLNRGERTDRLEVLWDLTAETPAEYRFDRRPPEVLGRTGPDDAPRPTALRDPDDEHALVRIPRDHPALRERDPALARAWRDAAAEALEACLAAGMVAETFLKEESAYYLTRHAWPVEVARR